MPSPDPAQAKGGGQRTRLVDNQILLTFPRKSYILITIGRHEAAITQLANLVTKWGKRKTASGRGRRNGLPGAKLVRNNIPNQVERARVTLPGEYFPAL